MHRKGVSHDVGCVMDGNWRPDYDPRTVRRELEIIVRDLRCTVVRITGRALGRLIDTAEGPRSSVSRSGTRRCCGISARGRCSPTSPEPRWQPNRCARYPGQLVFSVGSELTLLRQCIIPGRRLMKRLPQIIAGDSVSRSSPEHSLALKLQRHVGFSSISARQASSGGTDPRFLNAGLDLDLGGSRRLVL
jgi:hypothetical protein